jgi:hypothetical protein
VRVLIVISHGTWGTNSRHFNALSFPCAHTYGDKINCTSFHKFYSTTAEMAGQMASLFAQCCQCVHFFWDGPRSLYKILHHTTSHGIIFSGFRVLKAKIQSGASEKGMKERASQHVVNHSLLCTMTCRCQQVCEMACQHFRALVQYLWREKTDVEKSKNASFDKQQTNAIYSRNTS